MSLLKTYVCWINIPGYACRQKDIMILSTELSIKIGKTHFVADKTSSF